MEEKWKNLTSIQDFSKALESSYHKHVVIFKHSTTCPISLGAKKEIQGLDFDVNTTDFYYLDLLSYRDVSNAVAEELGVKHESPQVIVIKDGKPIYDESHYNISSDLVKKWL